MTTIDITPQPEQVELTRTRGALAAVSVVFVAILNLILTLTMPTVSDEVLAQLDDLAAGRDPDYTPDFSELPDDVPSEVTEVSAPVDVANDYAAWELFNDVTTVMWFGAVVAFLVWLWRARTVAGAVADWQLDHSRPKAIWSWFVPGVNLLLPYRVVAEIWQASKPDDDNSGRGLLVGWWTCWIVSLFASLFSVYDLATTLTSPQPSATFSNGVAAAYVSALAVVGAAVFLVPIIQRIDSWQMAAAQRR